MARLFGTTTPDSDRRQLLKTGRDRSATGAQEGSSGAGDGSAGAGDGTTGTGTGAGTGGMSKIAAVQAQLRGVRAVMMDNIDKVLARGEKLDSLAVRAEELNATSSAFRGMAARTKRQMLWRAVKHYAIVAGVVVLVVAVVVLAIAL